MDDERESKLPAWARQLIAELRQRVQCGNEPLLKELAMLRPKVASLKAHNDSVTELLRMAAKGGHLTSQDIMAVIQEYEPWKEN